MPFLALLLAGWPELAVSSNTVTAIIGDLLEDLLFVAGSVVGSVARVWVRSSHRKGYQRCSYTTSSSISLSYSKGAWALNCCNTAAKKGCSRNRSF